MFKKKTSLKTDNLVAMLPKLNKVHELSVEVFPTGYTRTYGNVLQLSMSDKWSRIPAIYFTPTSNSTSRLLIARKINGFSSYHTGMPARWTSDYFPSNKWIHIRIAQVYTKSTNEYISNIYIDNNIVNSIVNEKPQTYHNINVYAATPLSWDQTQSGYIRNLVISQKDEREIMPKTIENGLISTSAGTGFYLSCGIVEKLSSQDLSSCFQLCLQKEHCKSFSFSFRTNQCIVSNKRKTDSGCNVTKGDGFMYFEVN